MRKQLRWILLIVVLIFFAFLFADTQGVFDDRPYREIPHGNHVHYVPRDWDGTTPAGDFPTRPPGPTERITQDGRIVPK